MQNLSWEKKKTGKHWPDQNLIEIFIISKFKAMVAGQANANQ